jgi:putative sugar O-methyltransferase
MSSTDEFRQMVQEVGESAELYRPSRFWDSLNQVNADWLQEFGLENFKRTVSQNYFNWLIVSARDPQFRAVLRKWLRRPTARPLLARMANPDLLRTTIGLERKFGAYQRLVYRLFVGMQWEIARRDDRLGLADRLEEPTLGNPIEITSGGRRISQDLANSIVECNAIHQACVPPDVERPVVAELGAGYGRLAHVFLAGTRARYFIFDIPPALHVSQWYLSRLFPDRKIFRFRPFDRLEEVEGELRTADLAFFTPNQLERFSAPSFDVFTSISTLPEMSPPQIANYLALMARLTRAGVYLKQWRRWFNDKDEFEFTYDRLVLPEGWSMRVDRATPMQPHFQERAWVRAARS